MQVSQQTMQESETRVFGHFGEWLQGRLGSAGPVVLVSLPCPAFSVRAIYTSAVGFSLSQTPNVLEPEKVQSLLAALEIPAKGHWTLTADMPPGGGAGASTASLVAVARAIWPAVPAEKLAQACLSAEGATDPLMFSGVETRLWASREGRTALDLPALPAFDVVGGFWQQGERTDPADDRFPDIADLIAPWQTAARSGDRTALARLATQSAERTSALRGPQADPTAQLAQKLGALGWIRAHTGSARGLLFAPATAPLDAVDQMTLAGYGSAKLFSTGALS